MSIVGVSSKITSSDIFFGIPVYWSNANAKPTELSLLQGTSFGDAYGINNLGQIVGSCSNLEPFINLPIIWNTPNTTPKSLPLLQGTSLGVAYGINNLGQIIGQIFSTSSITIPVMWATPNDKPTPLQTLDNSNDTRVCGINNLGQMVGVGGTVDNNGSTTLFPLFWSNANAKPIKLSLPVITDVNTLQFGVIGINDLGQIVCSNFSSSNKVNRLPLFLSSPNATPTTLQLPDGITNGAASGINNLGQIVGFVGNKNSLIPVIWANADSKPTALQIPNGYDASIAIGISGPPTPTPISNICFPAGTPIQTDQGFINIDDIDPQIHTINNQPILHITKTTTLDNYLISFDKNSLERNIPCRKTLMTKDHKIMFEGNLVPAYRFLDYSDKVKKVKYSGEILYNILLAEYGTINVNNLECETLHPDNIIAKLYMREVEEQPRLICQLNSSLENKDFASYTDVVHKLTHNL